MNRIEIVYVVLLCTVVMYNKSVYSDGKHATSDFQTTNIKSLVNPFRMAKLNLLWPKAVTKLSESKLKSLFSELKLHDKEELTWKHLRAQGKDKDYSKEMELRKKLQQILKDYHLNIDTQSIDKANGNYKSTTIDNDTSDKYRSKIEFKDKKLNKLWHNAEISGFTIQELELLKEKFHLHQDNVDHYYSLLLDVKGGNSSHIPNTVGVNDDFTLSAKGNQQADYLIKTDLLRNVGRNIKEGINHLSDLTSKGPSGLEFIEPKVQGLWKIVLDSKSKFSSDELSSLRVDLLHYENILQKLRHLQMEATISEELHLKKKELNSGIKSNGQKLIDATIKRLAAKVEKMQQYLESKILQRHTEL